MRILSCIFLCAIFLSLNAQEVTIGNTTLTPRDVATGLQIPWELVYGPDDHLWVTERRGQILRIEPESGTTNTVLDIRGTVSNPSEAGMLGMVLHPQFDTNPYIYVVYTYGPNFSPIERLSRFEWNGEELINEMVLLDDIPAFRIHSGSRLIITPDQKILMTTGDRGDTDLPQVKSSINGKVLRINLDGSVPDDNPFGDSYVYSYGHRNPQGLCMAPNGIIYSSEHGPDNSDELNIIQPGLNYGWPLVQGACNTQFEQSVCDTTTITEPIGEWSPCVAVNGLAYYDHPAIPEFENSVLMAVLGGIGIVNPVRPRISQLKLTADGQSIQEENQYFANFGRLRDVCVNPHTGALYIATNGPQYPGEGPNRIIEYRNLEFTVSTPETFNQHQYIRIAPNPISNKGFIELSQNFVGHEYQIIAFSGQILRTGIVRKSVIPIDIDDFSNGSYYIKARNGLGIITRTFVVQR